MRERLSRRRACSRSRARARSCRSSSARPRVAIEISRRLLDRGVYVTGFGYPVVPEGTARVRIQVSAALDRGADRDRGRGARGGGRPRPRSPARAPRRARRLNTSAHWTHLVDVDVLLPAGGRPRSRRARRRPPRRRRSRPCCGRRSRRGRRSARAPRRRPRSSPRRAPRPAASPAAVSNGSVISTTSTVAECSAASASSAASVASPSWPGTTRICSWKLQRSGTVLKSVPPRDRPDLGLRGAEQRVRVRARARAAPRSAISSTAAWIAFSPASVSAPCAERPRTWTQASMSPVSASADPQAGRLERDRRAAGRARAPPCASRCRRAPRRPGRRRRRRAGRGPRPSATRSRAASRQATTPPLSSTEPSPWTTSPSTRAARRPGRRRSCRRGPRWRAPARSRARRTRLSRPSSLRTRRAGQRPALAQSSSIRSTIRPSEPEGDGISTSSASRSRASATVAPVGAQPVWTSCQARIQALEVVGLDLGDRVGDRSSGRRSRGTAPAPWRPPPG